MDLTSAMLVAEGIAKDGSYAAWHGGQSGIGALPLLLFGTEEQKQRYLPRVANAELVAAYALSEPQAGSDALAARTRADLSPDGKHYILNGQKMWITNGGAADLYTIFAKVDGEKFTAFLVERKFPGSRPGRRRKEDGHQRQLHHCHLSGQRAGTGGKCSGRDRPRPHHRVQYFEYRAFETGRIRVWRRQGSAARFA